VKWKNPSFVADVALRKINSLEHLLQQTVESNMAYIFSAIFGSLRWTMTAISAIHSTAVFIVILDVLLPTNDEFSHSPQFGRLAGTAGYLPH
jgi:hypothetical protein